jgi:hypothetical protein
VMAGILREEGQIKGKTEGYPARDVYDDSSYLRARKGL